MEEIEQPNQNEPPDLPIISTAVHTALPEKFLDLVQNHRKLELQSEHLRREVEFVIGLIQKMEPSQDQTLNIIAKRLSDALEKFKFQQDGKENNPQNQSRNKSDFKLTHYLTDKELDIAKKSYINTFPQKFATKAAVADVFAGDEFTGRHASDPEFWKTFRDKVAAINKADVQRVAKKYLTPEKLVMLVVGNKEDILRGHPDHPTKLTGLLGGKFTELPRRDPLTLLPMK